jgi:hypothetical protein
MQCRSRVAGRTLTPQLVNQKLAAYDFVRSQHKQREERPSFRARDLDRHVAVPNLESTEQAKFHASATLTPLPAGENPWKRL